ncbi:MAG: hypothetical protein JST82_00845 [Bacteroidetes bacterium]|nr:hypothetical protein [Bacteroidota bacterium]
MARHLYIFLSGFLLMLTINIYNDWSYEREILVNLREHVYQKCKTRDITTVVDSALHYQQMVQSPMTLIFSNKKFRTLKTVVTPASFQNFYYGKSACGAYAAFFTRLLTTMGYHAKIVQVNTATAKRAHMAVVIDYNNQHLVVDPYLGYSFKGPDGALSDINYVAANWDSYFKQRVPEGYGLEYDYKHGWSYTNWDKYGKFSQGLYTVLCKLFGKNNIDDISFHRLTMGYNKYYLLLSLLAFIFTALKAIRLNMPVPMKRKIIMKLYPPLTKIA